MIDALLEYDPRTKRSHIRIFHNDWVIHEFSLNNKEVAEEVVRKLNKGPLIPQHFVKDTSKPGWGN